MPFSVPEVGLQRSPNKVFHKILTILECQLELIILMKLTILKCNPVTSIDI